ncbi:hypothetical protein ACFFJ4_11305 [Xanthomonas dyei]|uniref:TnsE C-terminal domain-containing protein n=1 Tax=Xanthomonas dyei TaxID=743699 RepID=A0A2S7C207_9XANT|nr:hypothetical protein [Xanthomonas dyei]PPU55615.1 hypothetical protein XdyCFBP7245_12610 [Xanthomonas dyei]
MPTRVPPIQEFPKDGRIWRVDWLGRVERTSAEALIDVHLSPARKETMFLREQSDFDAHATVKLRVGVGLLPFLVIGSLWRNGRRQRKDFGYPRNFRNINIPETVGTTTAGLIVQKEPDTRWLIPKFCHQLDRSCWFSPLFAIKHEGDPYGILLPMIEVIRFYYVVSSDMAHIAFNGTLQLDLDSVINTQSTVDSRLHDSGRMVLHLRQWLADDDAWVIGRVLADANAKDGIDRIYNSLLRDTANYKTAFAECGLPFAGTTNWTTRGIEVPKEDGKGHRWLIYELTGCSAPFPFDSMEVVRDNDGRMADPESDLPDDEKRPAWSLVQKATKTTNGTEVQSDDPPRADLQAVAIPSAGERFSALRGKEIIKTPKDQCRYKKAAVPGTEKVDVLGTGDPSGSETAEGGAPASIEWQREIKRSESLPASFESLQAVVDALNHHSGTKAHVRELSGSTEFLRLTKPSGHRQWSYLDSARRTRRRVMVIDIDCDGVLGCLVEYERRDSERSRIALFVPRESGQVPESILIRLLYGLVAVEGVWVNLKSYPTDVRLELFNHSRPSAAKFAADLRDAMRKVV